MELRDLQEKIHHTAKDKGWWQGERHLGDLITLIHCELSEAYEEYRNGHGITAVRLEKGKPEGFPVEIADVVIRVLDLCGGYGIDLASVIEQKIAFNETRPYRHGGKLA